MTVIIDGTNGVQSVGGSASTASFTKDGDTNNGIFFPATDVTAITTAGSERLRVDASGNMGLGVTPSAWATNSRVFQVINSSLETRTDNPSYSTVVANGYINTSNSWTYVSSDYASRYTQFQGQHLWYTAPSGTAGNAITFKEVLQINAAGQMLNYATSGNGGSFNVYSNGQTSGQVTLGQGFSLATDNIAFLYNRSNADFVFGTNNTERARITSGGFFGLGVTPSYPIQATISNSNDWFAYFTNSSGTSPYGLVMKYSGATPNGTSNSFYFAGDATAARFEVRSNGGIANYSANDVNLSDQRVKKNVKPLGSMWDKFKAIEIVTFKYNDQSHDDDNIGVIAQQVESVAPEFIDVDGFGETPEDGVPLKTVYTTDMYHAAIKALQEAMARIESLEAKVAALEAK